MVRISGVDLPNKHTVVALTYIHGIGNSIAKTICDACNVAGNAKIDTLTPEQVNAIRKYIDNNCTVEGPLRTSRSMNIKRLIDIKSYRGIRHLKGLPVRGQRTQTNARTRKGKSKGAIVNKK